VAAHSHRRDRGTHPLFHDHAGQTDAQGALSKNACASAGGDAVGFYALAMNLDFGGKMWFWKGPAPWHFITVPEDECVVLEEAAAFVTYGWGMIPVTARIGATEWQTSLFPKDGRYIVPVKTWVREAEGLEVGDLVKIRLLVAV
jgi:hypothetical protein